MGIFVGVKLETHIQDHTITPKHVGYFSRFWTKKNGGIWGWMWHLHHWVLLCPADEAPANHSTSQASTRVRFWCGMGRIYKSCMISRVNFAFKKKKKSQVTQVTFKEFCGKFLPPYFGEMAWAPKPVKFSRILPLRHLTHLRRVGLGRPNLRLSLIGYRWCGLMLHIQMECMVDMYI